MLSRLDGKIDFRWVEEMVGDGALLRNTDIETRIDLRLVRGA